MAVSTVEFLWFNSVSYLTEGRLLKHIIYYSDTGYLPFYFQGYGVLFILLPGIWDTVFTLFTFRVIGYLAKLRFFLIIMDTCLFTSMDMGYLVPLYRYKPHS